MRKRRSFTREFKIAAVKKVLEKGLSVTEFAQELGIRDTFIHNWRRGFEADGSLQSEILNSPSMDTELRRLREENRQLKIERDILKKRRSSLQKKRAKIQVHPKTSISMAHQNPMPCAQSVSQCVL